MIKIFNHFNGIKNIPLAIWVIAIISALFVYNQADRGAPLLDYAYHIETAYRISVGDIPFQDFEQTVAPGTFIITSLLMKIGGKFFNLDWLVIYACIVQLMTVCLTWYVIKKLYRFDEITNTALMLPLTVSGHVLYPFPIYNGDTGLFILIALAYLIHLLYESDKKIILFFVAGILISLPTFFKQNVGPVFLMSCWIVLFITCLFDSKQLRLTRKELIVLTIGCLFPFVVIFIILASIGIFEQAVFQLFGYPSQIRPPIDKALLVIKAYFSHAAYGWYIIVFMPVLLLLAQKNDDDKKNDLLIFLPILLGLLVGIASYFILKIPPYGAHILSVWQAITVLSICFLVINLFYSSNTSLFEIMFPIVPIFTAQGAFLSQGIEGSSINMEMLLVMMCAYVLVNLLRTMPSIKWESLFISFMCVLSVFFGFYAYQSVRLSYVNNNPSSEVNHLHSNFKFGHLIGVRGHWLSHMEGILNFAKQNIPKDDRVAFFPGEDFFFFLTERKSYQSCLLLNINNCSQTPNQIFFELLEKKIKWVIIKRGYQCAGCFNSPNWSLVLEEDKIPAYYTLQAQSEFYFIFKRNDKPFTM